MPAREWRCTGCGARHLTAGEASGPAPACPTCGAATVFARTLGAARDASPAAAPAAPDSGARSPG